MSNAEREHEGRTGARRERSDGVRSRAAILDEAARLATVDGIGGLSIGRLAEAVGMSKSGLYAHFKSKEELQLATVDTAEAIFVAHVVEPGLSAATGLERLRGLVDGYLGYIGAELFPGGCFFASVLPEVDMHPGAVRDRLVGILQGWLGLLEAQVREAQADGAIEADEDPAQLAFELESLLLFANTLFVVERSTEPIERTRRAIERRLRSALTSSAI